MVRSILFIRLSALGDVVNTLPALSLARKHFPAARIGFVVEDRAKDLIVGHPDVDEVFVFERRRWQRELFRPRSIAKVMREAMEYSRRIRQGRFAVALNVQSNLKGAVHAVLSGAPWRIGFAKGHCKELSYLFSNIHVSPPSEVHRVEKFASLLAPLGIASGRTSLNGTAYKFPSSKESIERVERFLAKEVHNKPYIVIHPGTSEFGKAKRWPLERFAAVGRSVLHSASYTVLITWGLHEKETAERLCAMIGAGAVLSMETKSVLDLVELLKRASAFVSADTGPMHLAAACGTPCVAIFGHKEPTIYRPYGAIHRVLKRGRSSEDVQVDDVVQALSEILKHGL